MGWLNQIVGMPSVRSFLLLTAQIKAIGVQKVLRGLSGSESPPKGHFKGVVGFEQVKKERANKVQWLLQNSWPVLPPVPKLLLSAVLAAPARQKLLLWCWLGQGDSPAQHLFRLVFK